MVEEKFDPREFIKGYREQLGKIDETALIVLKGHLEVEADLDDALSTVFANPHYLKRAKLRFPQKVHLLRAMSEYANDEWGWQLLFAFNGLRNEIAHGRKSEERTAQVNELRKRLKGFGGAEYDKHIETCDEAEVAVNAAALSSGFVLEVAKKIKEKMQQDAKATEQATPRAN